jgi:splicing factor 3B subunit 3
MEEICQYYLGEVGTCISKARLSAGSQEAVVIGTTSGGLTALLPFETKEEIDFFVHLEMYLRIEA